MSKCIENIQCFTICKPSQENKVTRSILQSPKDPEYTIHPETSNEDCTLVAFCHSFYNILSLSHYTWIKEYCYLRKKDNGNSIVLLHLKNKNKQASQGLTILYSHGHNSTLGSIYPFLYDISTQLKCDIVAYDYCGYGQSRGIATESEIKSDIKEVYSFIQQMMPNEEILLFGHSLGSIPSVYLSSMAHELLGMILMSPISSDKNLLVNQSMMNQQEEEEEDLFAYSTRNSQFYILNKLSKISNPTFLIHGMLDTVIHQHHSIKIAKRLVEVNQWYPKNAGHYDIIELYREKFFKKIRTFISFLLKYKEVQVMKNSKSKTHIYNDIHSEGKCTCNKSINNHYEQSITLNYDDSKIL